MDGVERDEEPGLGPAKKEERSAGVTVTTNIAVAALFALVFQCGYVVYTIGRQSEKLDTVVTDVGEIKRAQYTQRDAERDLSTLRRADDQIHGRVRDLELRVFNPSR